MNTLDGILILFTTLYVIVALAFYVGLRKGLLPTHSSNHPYLSVVIAARNEADFIALCLSDLTVQTYPPDRFEVIVVDDESSDQTAQIVQKFASLHANIHLLNVGDQFPEMAAKKRPLSVGIQAAKGDWIVTTDADCRVPKTWLAQMSAYMSHTTDVIIGYSQIKRSGDKLTFFEKLQGCDFLTLMSAAAGSANLGYPLAATGQNFAYRKALFEQVGGFQKVAHRPSGDDVLLLQIMRKNTKNPIAFAMHPNSFASTHRTETPSSFWRQRKRWASNAAFQIRLNPIFFAYILIVFGLHASLPLHLIFYPANAVLALTCFVLKACADWIVVHRGAKNFGRTDLLSMWPAWEILQPFYIVSIGLAGTLGGFTWKDRHHS